MGPAFPRSHQGPLTAANHPCVWLVLDSDGTWAYRNVLSDLGEAEGSVDR